MGVSLCKGNTGRNCDSICQGVFHRKNVSAHDLAYFLTRSTIHDNASCRSFYATTGGVFFLLSVILETVQFFVPEGHDKVEDKHKGGWFSLSGK